jgi:hypothetical protein
MCCQQWIFEYSRIKSPQVGPSNSTVDYHYSRLKEVSGSMVSKPPEMMRDRDPDTGERFPTIMAMREKKLRDWLVGAAKLPYTHHIACRDYLLNATLVPTPD